MTMPILRIGIYSLLSAARPPPAELRSAPSPAMRERAGVDPLRTAGEGGPSPEGLVGEGFPELHRRSQNALVQDPRDAVEHLGWGRQGWRQADRVADRRVGAARPDPRQQAARQRLAGEARAEPQGGSLG